MSDNELQQLKDNTADDFADGWDWINIKWTDESKRLYFSCDGVNFTGILYWHEPDNCWIVELYEDMTNDAGKKIYTVLEECGSFDTHQDA